MTSDLSRRLRKAWHLLHRRFGSNPGMPQRIVVEKAKWLHDAWSPVMLMVDDLANAWHNHGSGRQWEPGGDWGGGHDKPGSVLATLENGLLRHHPEARVTFFTVAGPLSAYTRHQPFSHTAPLDANEESRRFFRVLSEDPRFELAYHGFDHGTPGVQSKDFIQEWRGFPSVDAAIAQTRLGLEHFRQATGVTPRGGKYGGWAYNDFAEAAIDASGFLWWCRDWTPRDESGRFPDGYYEPQFFGSNFVVALPSTVHGQFWSRRQIDLLLARRQVITIEEHIAPIRPDGLIQTPNIIDDMPELRRLYAYLKTKDVWHATGSEIAAYIISRELSLVHDVTREGFSLQYNGREERPPLTLHVNCAAICTPAKPHIAIFLPDGGTVRAEAFRFDRKYYRHQATVPVMEGRYLIHAREE